MDCREFVGFSYALCVLNDVRGNVARCAVLGVVGCAVDAVGPDVDHNVFHRGHSLGHQCRWHRAAGALYCDALILAEFAQAIGAKCVGDRIA